MMCQECWFAFQCDEEGVVTHPSGDMYTKLVGRVSEPCPNKGKRFRFPEEQPIEAIEIAKEKNENA